MDTNLRPLRLGEILDRTAEHYRNNFLLFAGISAVLGAGMLAINVIFLAIAHLLHIGTLAMLQTWWYRISSWASLVVMLIVGQVASAANNRAVAWVYLGEPATIFTAYRSILAQFRRYLAIGAVKIAIAWSPMIVLWVAFEAGSVHFQRTGVLPQPGQVPAPGTQLGSGFLYFALMAGAFFVLIWPAAIYSFFMALRYALALPASVVENLTTRQALKRSITLSKGARGRILVLWLVVGVIEVLALTVTQSFFVAYSMRHHFEVPLWLQILQQFIAFVTNTFVGPILATGTCLFYFDQRVRNEGYDIEWMMKAAGLTELSRPPSAEALLPVSADAVAAPPQFRGRRQRRSLRIQRRSMRMSELRPSTLGEILDRTVSLYRARFLVFFGIASVPSGVVLAFVAGFVLLFSQASVSRSGFAAGIIAGAIALCVLALPAMICANALSGAALCLAASRLAMGESISIASAFKAVWRRGWRLKRALPAAGSACPGLPDRRFHRQRRSGGRRSRARRRRARPGSFVVLRSPADLPDDLRVLDAAAALPRLSHCRR